MTQVLVDTSFLVALYNRHDMQHQRASDLLRSPESRSFRYIIPEVALTEVTYLLRREVGITIEAQFIQWLVETGAVVQCLTLADLNRAARIMLSYAEARFDFVDCCLIALCERLTITRLCTFDRRDFGIFRPNHAEALTLLP